jgi:hypothetical protein
VNEQLAEGSGTAAPMTVRERLRNKDSESPVPSHGLSYISRFSVSEELKSGSVSGDKITGSRENSGKSTDSFNKALLLSSTDPRLEAVLRDMLHALELALWETVFS